jgi:SAM-dependent methyltransferase
MTEKEPRPMEPPATSRSVTDTGGSEPRYATANAESGPERARLEVLQRLNDAATLRRLDAIGIETGWRCVEIGAGAGSIARALAERAGPQGLVVAADRDPRFLDDFAGPGREVATHDITDGPVEPGGFDFAHCRAVLTHVEDLETAVRHIVQSVRPGGWILCEEPDYGPMEACDPKHPHARDLASFRSIMTHGGRIDGYAGRNVFGALRAEGLSKMETESHGAIAIGGTLRAQFRRDSLELVRSLVLASGAFSQATFDRMLAAFDDPTFAYIDNAWIATRGQVPL